MIDPSPVLAADACAHLQRSYGRCLIHPGFLERFYALFMASHPDVSPLFAHTDFEQQQLSLRRGLGVALFHLGGSVTVRRTCEHMAQVHSRGGRAPVPPELYPYWVDSLVQAVREHDGEADDALLAVWREAMTRVAGMFAARF